jgi:hypothetical protein
MVAAYDIADAKAVPPPMAHAAAKRRKVRVQLFFISSPHKQQKQKPLPSTPSLLLTIFEVFTLPPKFAMSSIILLNASKTAFSKGVYF